MTSCIVCTDREEHDPDYESGFACCTRAWARMSGALRAIPELVDELAGLGLVRRDARVGLRAVAVASDVATRRLVVVYEPGPADPIAHHLTAGPLNGSKGAPRVSGSSDARVPIRVDSTDLLAPARHGSLAVADTGRWPQDQVGHLAVATELEFWARDWATERGENLPDPSVRSLSGWLLDRLDWACEHHRALDEFAAKITAIRSALTASCGRFDAPPETLSAPCPGCDAQPALYRDTSIDRIACTTCPVLMTEDEYVTYVYDMRDEMRAQDLLYVLNGLKEVDFDKLQFAVVTEVHEPCVFEPGEVLILKGNREAFGDVRRVPGNSPVDWQTFGTLDEALARRSKALDPGPAKEDARKEAS